MKYKILYLTYHPEIGGGETVLLSLISKLDRRQFQPIVVLPSRGQLFQKLNELKCQTYILPVAGYLIRTFFVPGTSPTGIYSFLKLAKKVKPDLIHVNHLNLAVYGGVVAKILKIPVVATAHGTWDSLYFYQDLVNQLFVDKILANTPQVAKALTRRKIVSSKKVKLVPFGVDTNVFKPANKRLARQKLRLPQNDNVITIAGRLDPVKDHLTFLKSAEIVYKKYPNALFYIVGSKLGDFSKNNNTMQKIQNFLKKNPDFVKNVVFAGFVKNMSTVYNASDILVSSSLEESFGLALAEAAACEVPVVSTNVGGQSLIIKDGVNGFLVPPENPNLLAQKILQLTKNPKLGKEFGSAGRKHIMKNFQIENYVRNVQKEYFKLLKGVE